MSSGVWVRSTRPVHSSVVQGSRGQVGACRWSSRDAVEHAWAALSVLAVQHERAGLPKSRRRVQGAGSVYAVILRSKQRALESSARAVMLTFASSLHCRNVSLQ